MPAPQVLIFLVHTVKFGELLVRELRIIGIRNGLQFGCLFQHFKLLCRESLMFI